MKKPNYDDDPDIPCDKCGGVRSEDNILCKPCLILWKAYTHVDQRARLYPYESDLINFLNLGDYIPCNSEVDGGF